MLVHYTFYSSTKDNTQLAMSVHGSDITLPFSKKCWSCQSKTSGKIVDLSVTSDRSSDERRAIYLDKSVAISTNSPETISQIYSTKSNTPFDFLRLQSFGMMAMLYIHFILINGVSHHRIHFLSLRHYCHSVLVNILSSLFIVQ